MCSYVVPGGDMLDLGICGLLVMTLWRDGHDVNRVIAHPHCFLQVPRSASTQRRDAFIPCLAADG
jgi:hypothetical protein